MAGAPDAGWSEFQCKAAGVVQLLDLNNSEIIAICSGIVALCALAVSVWQGYLMRKHNQISSRPHIEIIFDRNDDIKINLKNGGFGPAIITKATAKLGGIEIILKNENDYLRLINSLASPPHNLEFSCYWLERNTVISAGDELNLLTIHGADNHQGIRRIMLRALDELEVIVEYRCLYERPYLALYCPNTHHAA